MSRTVAKDELKDVGMLDAGGRLCRRGAAVQGGGPGGLNRPPRFVSTVGSLNSPDRRDEGGCHDGQSELVDGAGLV